MSFEKAKYVPIDADDNPSQDQESCCSAPTEVELKDFTEKPDEDHVEILDESNPSYSCKSVFKQLEGKLLIFVAGFVSVNVYSFGKHVSHLPVGQFSSIVFLFSLLFMLPILLFKEHNVTDFHGKAKYVITRAFLGALAGLFKFWAAKHMNYGDSVALGSLVPVFAALFSRILWKEKLSIFTVVALVVGLGGITLVAKPSFLFPDGDKKKDYGPLFPLVPVTGSVMLGFAFSCMRKVGTRVSSVLVSILVSSMVVVDGIVFQLIVKEEFVLPGCFIDRVVLCAAGFGVTVVLLLLNRGLTLEKSGPGVLIRNCDIVIAYGIQVLVFNSVPDALSIIGALMVLFSAVLVSANKLFFEKSCKCEI